MSQKKFIKVRTFPGTTIQNMKFFKISHIKNLAPDEHQYEILGLKNLRVKDFNKIIMGHLNINSIKNKSELLSSLAGAKIDTLMISETKLDATFPRNTFFIQVNSTVYRLDGNDKDGDILLCVKAGIIIFPSNRYSYPVGFEAFCVELNFQKKKMLIFCIYNPRDRFIKVCLKELGKGSEFRSKTYENIIIIHDFTAEISEPNLVSFCTISYFSIVIDKPTCIDLILTNCPNYFQDSSTFETGLSDFHILTLFKCEILQQ